MNRADKDALIYNIRREGWTVQAQDANDGTFDLHCYIVPDNDLLGFHLPDKDGNPHAYIDLTLHFDDSTLETREKTLNDFNALVDTVQDLGEHGVDMVTKGLISKNEFCIVDNGSFVSDEKLQYLNTLTIHMDDMVVGETPIRNIQEYVKENIGFILENLRDDVLHDYALQGTMFQEEVIGTIKADNGTDLNVFDFHNINPEKGILGTIEVSEPRDDNILSPIGCYNFNLRSENKYSKPKFTFRDLSLKDLHFNDIPQTVIQDFLNKVSDVTVEPTRMGQPDHTVLWSSEQNFYDWKDKYPALKSESWVEQYSAIKDVQRDNSQYLGWVYSLMDECGGSDFPVEPERDMVVKEQVIHLKTDKPGQYAEPKFLLAQMSDCCRFPIDSDSDLYILHSGNMHSLRSVSVTDGGENMVLREYFGVKPGCSHEQLSELINGEQSQQEVSDNLYPLGRLFGAMWIACDEYDKAYGYNDRKMPEEYLNRVRESLEEGGITIEDADKGISDSELFWSDFNGKKDIADSFVSDVPVVDKDEIAK